VPLHPSQSFLEWSSHTRLMTLCKGDS
jgi:hypothetical protein